MLKTSLAILLGVIIGAGCRWFDVPVPSPPRLLGALLVVAMILGYMAMDTMIRVQRGVGSVQPSSRQTAGGPGSVSARESR
jgi:XapX domain-containing protein